MNARRRFLLALAAAVLAASVVPALAADVRPIDREPMRLAHDDDPDAMAVPAPSWVRPAEKSDATIMITVKGGWFYELPDTLGWGPISIEDFRVEVRADGNVVALTTTNLFGQFSVAFAWAGALNPDLQVRFVARNDAVDALDYATHETYNWWTGVWHDFQGTLLDVGQLTTADDDLHAVLHQFQTFSRIHDWYADLGYPLARIAVVYPSPGQGFGGGEIGVMSNPDNPDHADPAWEEGGYAHEYTHYWQSVYAPAAISPLPYCNGICDGATDCGHCYWCPEAPVVVMVEGFAGIMGNVIPVELNIEYGVPIVWVNDNEHIEPCGALGWDPVNTEGMYGSLLQDIIDSQQDQHGVFGTWYDRLAEGAARVVDVTHLYNPTDPADFIAMYRLRYPTVNAANLWETAMNCGMDFDQAGPAHVTNLHSTSHTVGVASPDWTIDMAWTRATDDMSGVAGYSIRVGSSALMPDTVQDVGDVTSWHSATLSPGTWWVTVRSVDRSGRWGTGYASSGPYVIRTQEPADLEPHVTFGWSGPLVPRQDAAAMGTNVPAPTLLTGESAATWWNMDGINSGEAATSGGFACRILVDGEDVASKSWGVISAGGNYMAVNEGPLTIRGGRHMFEVFHDGWEQISETDETDNRWAHQWIWTPSLLPIGTLVTRAAPPIAEQGWDSVVDGSTVFYNCDGLSFASINYIGSYYSWDAVYVYADADSVDYDCRMHPHTTGPEDGFAGTNQLGTSIRGAGCLDAVLFNGNTQGVKTRDVGVLNRFDAPPDAAYHAMRLRASEIVFGSSRVTNLGAGAMMAFSRYAIDAADTGWVNIEITVDPPTQAATLNLYPATFANGKLENADESIPIVDGHLMIERRLTAIGRHALIVYRDPRDGRDPWTVTAAVGPALPDFTSYQPANWAGAVVPRPARDASFFAVAAPDTLHGDVASTYLNFAWRNAGHGDWSTDGVDSLITGISLDGADIVARRATSNFLAGMSARTLDGAARTVSAGRHTLALVTDVPQLLTEFDESNNRWGVQYCWSPVLLAFAAPVTRASPPDRTAGWDAVPDDQIVYYNCDGLRVPASAAATWRAVGVMPAEGGDVDLRLHAPLNGASGGYGGSFVSSGWGQGEIDFALVDGYAPPGGSEITSPFDVGVVRPGVESAYSAETVTATTLSPAPSGEYGPYALAAGHLLHLYEIDLTAGTWRIDLANVSGTVDWGLSVYAPPSRFRAKSDAVAGGIAWQADRGEDERVIFAVAEPGRYALAVWKSDARVTAEAGSYRLTIANPVSGTPEGGELPSRSGLVAIRPNPFNPQTVISYELAAPSDVVVAVFDLRGRRVRTLFEGARPAGGHQVVWDGRDAAGGVAASGVYVVRLQAGGANWMSKVSLLK